MLTNVVVKGTLRDFFSTAGRASPEIRLAVGQKNVYTMSVAHFFGSFFYVQKISSKPIAISFCLVSKLLVFDCVLSTKSCGFYASYAHNALLSIL